MRRALCELAQSDRPIPTPSHRSLHVSSTSLPSQSNIDASILRSATHALHSGRHRRSPNTTNSTAALRRPSASDAAVPSALVFPPSLPYPSIRPLHTGPFPGFSPFCRATGSIERLRRCGTPAQRIGGGWASTPRAGFSAQKTTTRPHPVDYFLDVIRLCECHLRPGE